MSIKVMKRALRNENAARREAVRDFANKARKAWWYKKSFKGGAFSLEVFTKGL